MNQTNKWILTGLYIAIGIILPQVFHPLNLGQVISPMHFSVILCGLMLGYKYGVVCGIVTPILGGILFNMPPFYPVGISMAIELSVYGLVTGLFYNNKQLVNEKVISLYLCLILAIILGRFSSALVNSILVLMGESNQYLGSYLEILFVIGLPGIVLQLLIIPPIVLRLANIQDKKF